MIKEYNQTIQQKDMHIEQTKTYYRKNKKLNVTILKKIKKRQKMIKFNYIARGNIKEYNPNWPQILDQRYRIL